MRPSWQKHAVWCRIVIFCFVVLSVTGAYCDDQASAYREIYPCEERGPTSICIVGAIPPGTELTLISKDQAISAKPIRELPDQAFSAGLVTGTLLQASKAVPVGSGMIAVLAPSSTISVVLQSERNDPALVRKVETYIGTMNYRYPLISNPLTNELEHRWLNPHVATTRIIGLTQRLSIAEATVRYDEEVYAADGKTLAINCRQCAEEKIALFARDGDLSDVFDRTNTVLCSEFVSAYQMAGRLYVYSTANGCSNGIYVAQVQDVTGPAPRSVFASSFFSN